ncbi:hypothetical protein KIN20_029571 [Parelaphostrongylus tenuis]|uniref:Uncharacterized protein n=1 Tax=Parelaphostrongylus tenuis TaxID=148309 RepID=A0AAD5R2R9_PARTN|nr:hypothetical protein KIN20_029571 [Parelaphostrongylus tenuis]
MELTSEQIRMLMMHEWLLLSNATVASERINLAWGEDTVGKKLLSFCAPETCTYLANVTHGAAGLHIDWWISNQQDSEYSTEDDYYTIKLLRLGKRFISIGYESV